MVLKNYKIGKSTVEVGSEVYFECKANKSDPNITFHFPRENVGFGLPVKCLDNFTFSHEPSGSSKWQECITECDVEPSILAEGGGWISQFTLGQLYKIGDTLRYALCCAALESNAFHLNKFDKL